MTKLVVLGGSAKAVRLRKWLSEQPEDVRHSLLAALANSENAAGDWFESRGMSRTSRKFFRIEK